MDSKNSFRIDFADNPELKEYFQRKSSGDTCRLEIEVQVNEVTQDGIEATIEEIVLPDDADQKKVKASTEKPIAMIVMAGKGKAKEEYQAA